MSTYPQQPQGGRYPLSDERSSTDPEDSRPRFDGAGPSRVRPSYHPAHESSRVLTDLIFDVQFTPAHLMPLSTSTIPDTPESPLLAESPRTVVAGQHSIPEKYLPPQRTPDPIGDQGSPSPSRTNAEHQEIISEADPRSSTSKASGSRFEDAVSTVHLDRSRSDV
jgi:hypothetical protein